MGPFAFKGPKRFEGRPLRERPSIDWRHSPAGPGASANYFFLAFLTVFFAAVFFGAVFFAAFFAAM